MLQSQDDLSPVVNALMSGPHQSPSKGPTLKSSQPARLIWDFSAYDSA